MYDLEKGISKFHNLKIKVDFLFMQEKYLHMIKKFRSHNIIYESLGLCLVSGKFEGKCEGKKIQRKNRRKEKVKENKKWIKDRKSVV